MPLWLSIILVVIIVPAVVVGLLFAACWSWEWLAKRRRARRVEYVCLCADAARIAQAVATLDHHLGIQSEMFAEDRNDEMCDALLEVREILQPSIVAAS